METNEFNKVYKQTKEKYPETIILCRCGQFYLAYGQDAEDCVKILNLAPVQDSNREYVVGFPHGELYDKLRSLVKAGKKVAILSDYFTKTA